MAGQLEQATRETAAMKEAQKQAAEEAQKQIAAAQAEAAAASE